MKKFTTLSEMIAIHAQDTPDAIAISAPAAKPLTYRALHVLVGNTVSALNKLGVGRGDRVGIVLPNCPEMATAFVTIASGCTAAPLNMAYRADEFEFYLSDLKAKALVVASGSDTPARAVAVVTRIAASASTAAIHRHRERTATLLRRRSIRTVRSPGSWKNRDSTSPPAMSSSRISEITKPSSLSQ